MVKKALVIDDSFVNREIIRDYLEDVSIEVMDYSDGRTAVKELADGGLCPYDCIFVDIQMPDMNGYETARAIRNIGNGYDKVRIISMSANSDSGSINKAYECGMNEYIVKPVDMRTLYVMMGVQTPSAPCIPSPLKSDDNGMSP